MLSAYQIIQMYKLACHFALRLRLYIQAPNIHFGNSGPSHYHAQCSFFWPLSYEEYCGPEDLSCPDKGMFLNGLYPAEGTFPCPCSRCEGAAHILSTIWVNHVHDLIPIQQYEVLYLRFACLFTCACCFHRGSSDRITSRTAGDELLPYARAPIVICSLQRAFRSKK